MSSPFLFFFFQLLSPSLFSRATVSTVLQNARIVLALLTRNIMITTPTTKGTAATMPPLIPQSSLGGQATTTQALLRGLPTSRLVPPSLLPPILPLGIRLFISILLPVPPSIGSLLPTSSDLTAALFLLHYPWRRPRRLFPRLLILFSLQNASLPFPQSHSQEMQASDKRPFTQPPRNPPLSPPRIPPNPYPLPPPPESHLQSMASIRTSDPGSLPPPNSLQLRSDSIPRSHESIHQSSCPKHPQTRA